VRGAIDDRHAIATSGKEVDFVAREIVAVDNERAMDGGERLEVVERPQVAWKNVGMPRAERLKQFDQRPGVRLKQFKLFARLRHVHG